MTDRTIPIFSTLGNLSPETMNLEQDKIGQLIALEMLVSSLPGAAKLFLFFRLGTHCLTSLSSTVMP